MPSFPFFKSKKAPVATSAQNPIPNKHHAAASVQKTASFGSSVQTYTQDKDSSNAIKYTPVRSEIKEIRLLELLPGSGKQPLQCSLQHTVLAKNHTPYETVSYCWAEVDGKDRISIDAYDAEITMSAAIVLRKMRHPCKPRMLWIDAICIDQKHLDEKSAQVALMGDIYREGFRNLIWLGDVLEANQVERAMKSVLSNVSRCTKGPGHFRELMAGPPGAMIHDGKYFNSNTDWAALRRLFERKWFTRLWVAQEAALSRSSVCFFGHGQLPLRDVLNIAIWLVYNSLCLPADLVNEVGLYAARAMWYILDEKDSPDTDLFAAFIMAQNLDATNPKDHVYALRSLYHDQNPQLKLETTLLRPDYAETKSHYEVFRDATRAAIEDSGHINILRFVDPSKTPECWPSWLMHFNIKTDRDKDPICWTGTDFQADNNISHYPARFKPPSILVAYGVKIDNVAEMSARFSKARSWESGEHSLLMDKVGKMIRKRRGHANWAGELATTLVAGGIRADDKTSVKDFTAFLKYSSINPHRPPVAKQGQRYDESNMRASRWFQAFERTMYGRRFFMTNIGFPGVGPLEMEPNDLVVILCGASVPFIVRPDRKHHGRYRLIGVCYVFGIMHGEAAYEAKVEPLEIF